MSDTSTRPNDPDRIEPTITPPGGVEEPISPAAAGMQSAIGRHPVAGNLGAARAEEHGAPAPAPRIGAKLWIAGALIVIAAIGAVAFA